MFFCVIYIWKKWDGIVYEQVQGSEQYFSNTALCR